MTTCRRPALVASFVGNDAHEPRTQGATSTEAIEGLVGLDEGVLHGVLRLWSRAADRERNPQGQVRVGAHDHAVGFGVSDPGPLDEFVLFHLLPTLTPRPPGRFPQPVLLDPVLLDPALLVLSCSNRYRRKPTDVAKPAASAPPAVVFGGPSPEHDVSILSGLQATRALAAAGHRVGSVYWSKTKAFYAVEPTLEAVDFRDGIPKGSRELTLGSGGFVISGGRLGGPKPFEVGVLVNCCHGGPGEDGTLQGLLDIAGIAYTGPSLAGAALGMDKLAFGAVVVGAGLPSLPRALVSADAGWHPGFDGPYILKPRFGGSSIGIEVVADVATAQARLRANVHFAAGCVAEPYREGIFDLLVGVRTHPHLELSAIAKPLRRTKGTEILTYADKYTGGEGMVSAPQELPAVLPPDIEARLRDAAARVATLCEVRGVARLDFLLDGDDLYVNEINTIPGSLAKHLWIDPPIPFATLLIDMLAEAAARPTARYSTVGADGSALSAAGTIGSKLG